MKINIDASERGTRLVVAILIMSMAAAALVLDGLGFKPSDILLGGLVTAMGAMIQKVFETKTPHADEAMARAIDKLPPLAPEPGETTTTTLTSEKTNDSSSDKTSRASTSAAQSPGYAPTAGAPADFPLERFEAFGLGEEGKP